MNWNVKFTIQRVRLKFTCIIKQAYQKDRLTLKSVDLLEHNETI